MLKLLGMTSAIAALATLNRLNTFAVDCLTTKYSPLALIVLLFGSTISTSASYGFGETKTKYNLIQNFQDEKCLESNNLVLCNDKSNNQVWYIEPRDGKNTWHTLFNIGEQKCLTANGNSTITLQICDGKRDDQSWYPESNGDGTYNLYNKRVQKCLFRNQVNTCRRENVGQRWSIVRWDKF